MNDNKPERKTQAERFGHFIATSRPPIATGTVRRFLDEHAAEITANVVRFRDGSEIQRADGSLGPNEPKNVSPSPDDHTCR